MINDGSSSDVVGKFVTEIISQNKIKELEKELDEVKRRVNIEASKAKKESIRAKKESIRANEAEAENFKLRCEIEMLKNQLNSN